MQFTDDDRSPFRRHRFDDTEADGKANAAASTLSGLIRGRVVESLRKKKVVS
jgi:hypothetical protein